MEELSKGPYLVEINFSFVVSDGDAACVKEKVDAIVNYIGRADLERYVLEKIAISNSRASVEMAEGWRMEESESKGATAQTENTSPEQQTASD